MAAAAPLAFGQIHTTPIALVDESPTNTRRTWGNLDELAASFKQVGILQPLVARSKGERFELVFGHRRLRAAKLAKLDDVPLLVRSMTDDQAHEAQVIENLQRTDLHPLEEAEGFEQLHKFGWSADEMAAKIGKSRAYVFARLKLLELVPEAREAFYAGKLTASVALLLARVPASLQPEALEQLDEEAQDIAGWAPPEKYSAKMVADPISARAAAQLLRDRYMLRLADAPFDRGDAELVPGAGACKDCPKRSGNQKELFADVPSADVCTDPVCFGEKKKASAAGVIARLEKKGAQVLEGKPTAYGGPTAPAGYVKLTDYCPEAGKTFGEVAKQKRVAKKIEERGRVVMLDERNKPVELVKKADVLEAADLKGKGAATRGGYTAPTEEQVRAQKTKRDADDAGDADAMGFLVAAVEKGGLSDALVRVLVKRSQWEMRGIAKRRGWHETKHAADMAKLKGNALLALLVEFELHEADDLLEEACKLFKIDLKGLRATELVRLKAIATAEAAEKPAPAKKAKKKGKANR